MPTLFKRSNGIYYISFEEEGIRKWKSTGQTRKPAALKELLTFEKLRKSYKPRTTLQSFITEFLAYAEVTFASKTLELYRIALRHFHSTVGNKLLTSITARDVDRFRIQRSTEVSPVSVNISLRTLRAAFSTAVRWRLISENPFKRVPLLRIPDQQPIYLSRGEFQRLVSLVSEARLRELITVAVSAGLRRGELLNLAWKDVDFQNRLLYIHSTDNFHTKGGKRRTVPMSEALFKSLWKKANVLSASTFFL